MEPLQGLFNAIIYGYGNSYIRNKISKFIFCKNNSKNSSSEIKKKKENSENLIVEESQEVLFQDGVRVNISTKI